MRRIVLAALVLLNCASFGTELFAQASQTVTPVPITPPTLNTTTTTCQTTCDTQAMLCLNTCVSTAAASTSAHTRIRCRRHCHCAREGDGCQRDYDLAHHGVPPFSRSCTGCGDD